MGGKLLVILVFVPSIIRWLERDKLLPTLTNTLTITLQGALSPAEIALANSPIGAAQIQELFMTNCPRRSHRRMALRNDATYCREET